MQQKQVVDLLNRIENSCGVNDITWNGIMLWPLIRLNLWWSLTELECAGENSKTLKKQAQVNGNFYNSFFYTFNNIKHQIAWYCSDLKFRNWLRKVLPESTDVMFLHFEDEIHEESAENIRNRHLDPLCELSGSLGYSALNVFVNRSGKQSFDDISEHCQQVELDIRIHQQPKFRFQRTRIRNNIKGLRVLDNVNRILPGTSAIDDQSLASLVENLQDYIEYFKKIFSVIRPRTVFFTCYYRIETMALISICKLLNIKTVDVQHGKQGKYHGLYTHWSVLPDDGYRLLPDYFWNWGREAARNIRRHRAPDYSQHKPRVGGYLWMEKKLSEDRKAGKLPGKIAEKSGKSNKIILVSLQPLPDSPPDNLLKAMSDSPGEWLWLIRLHPRQMDSMDQIDQLFIKNGIKNFEMEISSTCSLYSLLPYVDCHITAWSTVLIEALVFKVPSIIITPQGYEIFRDKIEVGIFWYAAEAENILALLSGNDLVVKENAHEEYFVLDRNVSRELFGKIMNETEIIYG